MAGGQLDYPTTTTTSATAQCEPGIAAGSPRFDINEFLKTPKDATTTAGDQFFNYATFNAPCNLLTPLVPTFTSKRPSGGRTSPELPAKSGSEPDFSALLLDVSKGNDHRPTMGDDQGAYAEEDTLIAFDELDTDMAKSSAFSLFSDGAHVDSYLNHFVVPPMPREHAPGQYVAPCSRHQQQLQASHNSSTGCTGAIFAAKSYLGSPGDLVGVPERQCEGRAIMAHGASTSGAAAAAAPVDWSQVQPPFGSSQPHNQQIQCASCQILRRIIHSNGVQDTKLEIHGCDGHSYHAVLQTRFCIDDGFPTSFEQQMVEFPVGNAEYVKQFLLQYSLLRRKEGFALRQDSLASHGSAGLGQLGMASDHHQRANAGANAGHCMAKQMGHIVHPDSSALCTSSEFSNSGFATYGKAALGQSKLYRSGSIESTDNADSTVGPAKPPKSNAAAQRERTGKLKMADLAQHFHLPINAAAKELGICPTVLKKICRRNGMRRWPHRKIKSIERIIATLEQTIAEGAGQGDEGIRMEIAMLRNERAQLCAGFLGDS